MMGNMKNVEVEDFSISSIHHSKPAQSINPGKFFASFVLTSLRV
jgi:hypothetical protein